MAADFFTFRKKRVAGQGLGLNIAQALQPRQHAALGRENPCHGMACAVKAGEAFKQVQKPAAFGVHGLAAGAKQAHGLAHGSIAAESFGMQLGIAAGQIQALHIGKLPSCTGLKKTISAPNCCSRSILS